MRFSDPAHLERWASDGTFPKIHTPLFQLVTRAAEGRSACDLCCATGLLGRRLVDSGFHVIGVERNHRYLTMGLQFNVGLTLYRLDVNPRTFEELGTILRQNQVTTLVARRCFSEIFARHLDSGQDFARMLIRSGVRQVFLQGRVPRADATHPIPTVEHEADLISGPFSVVELRGQLAHLEATH